MVDIRGVAIPVTTNDGIPRMRVRQGRSVEYGTIDPEWDHVRRAIAVLDAIIGLPGIWIDARILPDDIRRTIAIGLNVARGGTKPDDTSNGCHADPGFK
jgi:hypothetical protein